MTSHYKPRTVKEAAALARCVPHGSAYHTEAMTVLFEHYRRAFPKKSEPSLEDLWAWVDGYLELQEASYESTPLG